jgi:hypothetical protein
MKLTIDNLATDCDAGTQAQLFTNENARDDTLLEWAGSSRDEWQASHLADDLHEFVQTKTDYLDTFSTCAKEIDVDLAQLTTVNKAWFRCKDTPGSFGNLYDPDEVMTIEPQASIRLISRGCRAGQRRSGLFRHKLIQNRGEQ